MENHWNEFQFHPFWNSEREREKKKQIKQIKLKWKKHPRTHGIHKFILFKLHQHFKCITLYLPSCLHTFVVYTDAHTNRSLFLL